MQLDACEPQPRLIASWEAASSPASPLPHASSYELISEHVTPRTAPQESQTGHRNRDWLSGKRALEMGGGARRDGGDSCLVVSLLSLTCKLNSELKNPGWTTISLSPPANQASPPMPHAANPSTLHIIHSVLRHPLNEIIST